MIPGSEGIRAAAAAPGIHSHRQERKSDRNDHTGRDHRRQIPLPVLCAQSHYALKDTAEDDGSYHAFITQIRIGADHQQASQEGKADTHDDRQLRADLPDRVQLQTGSDAGHKHGTLQKPCDLHRGQGFSRSPDNRGAAHDQHRRQI